MAKVVTGTTADDVHVIGIRLLEMALRDAGHTVIALGALVSNVRFVEAVIESDADAIFVSSLNGHAQYSLAGLRDQLVEAGAGGTLIYAGGQLAIGRPDWNQLERLFIDELGLDRIYSPDVSLERVLDDLQADVADSARS